MQRISRERAGCVAGIRHGHRLSEAPPRPGKSWLVSRRRRETSLRRQIDRDPPSGDRHPDPHPPPGAAQFRSRTSVDGSSGTFIENAAFAQRLGQEVPRVFLPVGSLLFAIDQNVLGYRKAGECTPEERGFAAAAPLFAEAFPFDHEQIDVRTGPCFAAGVGAEEDDSLRPTSSTITWAICDNKASETSTVVVMESSSFGTVVPIRER